MSTIWLSLGAIVVTLIVYAINYARKVNRHWADRGIPHFKPHLFIGNSLRNLLQKCSMAELQQELYEQFPDEPIFGIYEFMKCSLVVKDPVLLEKMMIKDFRHFVDHGFPVNENANPLDINLFNMCGNRWRAMRNKFSPLFTSGKLKNMFFQMCIIGDNMSKVMETEDKESVDLKDILGRFTMDVIGSCAFGLETGSLADRNCDFRMMGKDVFNVSGLQFLKFILVLNFPNLALKLGISFNKRHIQNYFCNIIKDTVKYRKENNVHRNDFVELMIQLTEKGHVEIQTKDPNDDYLGIEPDTYSTSSYEITEDILTGQAFIFLTAGFEATASTMTYAFYELAKNPEVQERARADVLEQVKANGGKLDYDSIKDMNYLDMCVKETMRKHPSIGVLFRICTKEYTFPNGITVKPGDQLLVPVQAIHQDPQYYPDPMKFDPERFRPDVSRPPCSYLPFGEGPRICIAMRFAMMEMRLCIARILLEFKISINPKTKEPLQCSPRNFITTPKDKIYFNLAKVTA